MSGFLNLNKIRKKWINLITEVRQQSKLLRLRNDIILRGFLVTRNEGKFYKHAQKFILLEIITKLPIANADFVKQFNFQFQQKSAGKNK